MFTPNEHQALRRRRDELRQELAHIGELRQGSLSSRYRKFHRFQRLPREFVDVSTRLCDVHLEANKPATPEKKGGSRRRSRRSARPRLRI